MNIIISMMMIFVGAYVLLNAIDDFCNKYTNLYIPAMIGAFIYIALGVLGLF